ncbi:MAG: hypothetical protein CMI08_17925 [Oceanospirillaceae bacterium]|uniref:TIGR02466 family protein n=1 Tax=unclassified Thalassolituus TaxID=2624967 RepID=UPI000C0ACCA2|nr:MULTISPECIES: TIGR02466 family protein [unclassified Thalassolituus]MAK90576.1 hypothetical protein [Thalassolituus sp.]MAY01045.1 hypothetical protein [Oceanospirillaceae bacterium]MBL36541.1 hypothetical protein [Oceanospirillaceae bacterium]MBS53391.1 hypothetical protein [Oceanospirillaceae bacterium]|tara:strand:+ start:2284 stop:2916 length:633 start_codon:yes stop_codon:yes gene_type:complete
MSTNIDSHQHFGVPVFEATLADFNDHQAELADYLLSMRAQAGGVERSNMGGWHSDDKLHADKHPAIRWLTQAVYSTASACIRHQNPKAANQKILLTQMWANINEAGDWNSVHHHLPCEWSGCVYISVGALKRVEGRSMQDGDIIFIDGDARGEQYGRPTSVSYHPANGRLFLFPGYQLHMVAPHREEEPRISVAFNLRLQPADKSPVVGR